MPDETVDDDLVVDDPSESVDQETDDKKPEPTVAELQSQLKDAEKDRDREKERADVEKQSHAYWYKEAKDVQGKAKAPAPERPEPVKDALEELPEIDLTAVVTHPKGLQKLVKILKDNGVLKAGLTEKDVQDRIDAKYNQATQESREADALAQKYPDIRDQSSEFTKAVASEMAVLQNDPGYKGLGHVKLAEIAADRVELRLVREGKRPVGKDPEQDRADRIARQSGGTSRSGASKAGKDELTADQKLACVKLGVSEADYIKSANEGIRMVRRANRAA
jgi:hypothetical protein